MTGPNGITSQTDLLQTSQRILLNDAAHWTVRSARNFPAVKEMVLPLVAVAIHFIVNLVTPYDIHRDEFLYAAMGRHLSLFGMDFPPLIAIIAEAERLIFGSTLFGLRLVPAICHGALVYFTGRLARRMGGNKNAALLASFAVLLSPLTMRAGSLFQPVIIDQLTWTVGYLALARLATNDSPNSWRWLGVIAGIGLLAKFSIAFFAVGVLLALLVGTKRKAFATRSPWEAALIALVIGSPSIIGQIVLGWPVRGQMKDLSESQLQRVTPIEFFGEQILYGPMMWLGVVGLIALFRWEKLRAWRVIGIATLTTTLLLLLLHGKGYYLGPIWPALSAAGAVWLVSRAHGKRRWILPTAAMVTLVYGALIAIPIGLPILPTVSMARYAERMGITNRTNLGEIAPLPQDFADMLGWKEFVLKVGEVWDELPAAERATAVLVGTNYGRAGAIDWYGPKLGLPPAICPCGSYWFWGHGTRPGPTTVIAGGDSADVASLFQEFRAVRVMEDPWRVSEEKRVTIWVARGIKVPLAQLWELQKGEN